MKNLSNSEGDYKLEEPLQRTPGLRAWYRYYMEAEEERKRIFLNRFIGVGILAATLGIAGSIYSVFKDDIKDKSLLPDPRNNEIALKKRYEESTQEVLNRIFALSFSHLDTMMKSVLEDPEVSAEDKRKIIETLLSENPSNEDVQRIVALLERYDECGMQELRTSVTCMTTLAQEVSTKR